MTQALEQQIYTPEAYLELELASETHSEYRDGAIIPMTGGTPDHNEIAVNLAALLKAAFSMTNGTHRHAVSGVSNDREFPGIFADR